MRFSTVWRTARTRRFSAHAWRWVVDDTRGHARTRRGAERARRRKEVAVRRS